MAPQDMLPNLPEVLDTLTEEELDLLPVGVLQLDTTGRILQYNAAEGKRAGRRPKDVKGLNFFDDVAPCTRVVAFRGRFEEGVRARSLHAVFPFLFRFGADRVADVIVTLFWSDRTESVWVVVRYGPGGLQTGKL